MKNQMKSFIQNLESRIGNHKALALDNEYRDEICFPAFGNVVITDNMKLPYIDKLVDLMHDEINQAYLEELNDFIGSKLLLPGRDLIHVLTIVKKRKLDCKDESIGEYNTNPVLDLRIYKLEFPVGRVEEYSTNTIIENILHQVENNECDAS